MVLARAARRHFGVLLPGSAKACTVYIYTWIDQYPASICQERVKRERVFGQVSSNGLGGLKVMEKGMEWNERECEGCKTPQASSVFKLPKKPSNLRTNMGWVISHDWLLTRQTFAVFEEIHHNLHTRGSGGSTSHTSH